MPNRAAKFVSAIFVSLLACANLTIASDHTARAANACLSGPNGTTPDGSHWYYRIDRATKRHCWYLGDEREKLSPGAPQISSASANPVSPPNKAMQSSIADAHAELPLPQIRIEQELAATAAPGPSAPSAASAGYNQRITAPDADSHRSVFASRWPEPSGVSPSTGTAPAAVDRVANLQSNPGTASPPSPAAVSAPAVAAVKLAAADSSSEKQPSSIQMLLVVIVGALSLAGMIGSAIFRLSSRQRAGRRKTRSGRRAIWDSIDADRPWSSAYPNSGRSMPGAGIAHDRRAADDPGRRIAEMLARLSRNAQA